MLYGAAYYASCQETPQIRSRLGSLFVDGDLLTRARSRVLNLSLSYASYSPSPGRLTYTVRSGGLFVVVPVVSPGVDAPFSSFLITGSPGLIFALPSSDTSPLRSLTGLLHLPLPEKLPTFSFSRHM